MRQLFLALVTVVFLMSGCATLPEVTNEVMEARKAGINGVEKEYPVTANQAWEITEAVFRWHKVDEIEEHRDQNYLIASTGMNMVAFGTVMGVWIEPVNRENTRITAITKYRGNVKVFSGLTPETFYRGFEQGLHLVKSGKELPFAQPLH